MQCKLSIWYLWWMPCQECELNSSFLYTCFGNVNEWLNCSSYEWHIPVCDWIIRCLAVQWSTKYCREGDHEVRSRCPKYEQDSKKSHSCICMCAFVISGYYQHQPSAKTNLYDKTRADCFCDNISFVFFVNFCRWGPFICALSRQLYNQLWKLFILYSLLFSALSLGHFIFR